MATEVIVQRQEAVTFDADMLAIKGCIRRSGEQFFEIGERLDRIKSSESFKEAGFLSFDDACRDHLGISATHAYRIINAAKVRFTLAEPNRSLITTERAARAVAEVDPEDRDEVIQEAAQSGPVTGPAIERAEKSVKTRKPAPPPKSGAPKPEALIDKAGREYRDPKVMEALGYTVEFEKLVDQTNELRRGIEHLAKNPVGRHLEKRLKQIQADLKNVSAAIRFAVPYTTCPYHPNCVRGCATCDGAHWITEEIWKLVPEEDRT